VWEAVRELTRSGVTILLTTQYLEEADELADRVALIDGGCVVAEGTSDELKARVGAETLDEVFLTLTESAGLGDRDHEGSLR
jgi:ABC-type multidrug transport system ATPase subunit